MMTFCNCPFKENVACCCGVWRRVGSSGWMVGSGGLTIFLFHVTHRKTTIFGQNKILRGEPYGYVPVSECRAWRAELEERAVAQGRITQEELEGAKPDWHGEFLKWRNKKERFGLKEHLAEMEMTVEDLVKDVFKRLVGTVKPVGATPKPTKRKA